MPAGVSAYTPLANITLSSSASSVTFSSISQSYRDLVLVTTASVVSGAASLFYRFNGDAGYNYLTIFMQGDGSITNSGTSGATGITASTLTSELSTSLATATLQILDYATTDKHKTALIRSNNASVVTIATAARWTSTSAVTSLVMLPTGVNSFAAGSTFALYGVSA